MRIGIERLTALLTLIFLITLVASARAQSPAGRAVDSNTGLPVEEVLVTGEHPGPGMWQVRNGDNTLWILGTHAPLPRRMIWRSQEVELIVSEAQQVLGSYSASFVVRGENPFAIRGKPLRRLLSRRAYAQWRTLKRKYIGDDDEIETALPVTAALVLRSNAFAQAGLGDADVVLQQLHRLARDYQVPVTTDHQVTKAISHVSVDREAERRGIAFLEQTMNNLEADLRTARMRANAWATGDIEALRAQADTDMTTARLYASSWPFLDEAELAELAAETDRRWLDAAERALRNHRTTIATLPIFMLLREDGLLEELRARGFEVIEPTR